MSVKGNRKVMGLGINDADYAVHVRRTVLMEDGTYKSKIVWMCPFHKVWTGLITRALSERFKLSQPSYQNTTVCDEWLLFSNFKSWMETQDWEGNYLDKDLLGGDADIYSPETCVFVSRLVNNFICVKKAKVDMPLGVDKDCRYHTFRAECNQLGRGRGYIGSFRTKEEAHQAYCLEKLRLAKILAEQQDDQRVAEALIIRYEKLLEKSLYEKG